VTNKWKQEKLMKEFAIPAKKMICESNAVDFKLFDVDLTLVEAREKLNLPKDKFIATYVGMLRTMNMEKGIGTLISAVKKLPERFILLLVGGKSGDVEYYRNLANKEGIGERVI